MSGRLRRIALALILLAAPAASYAQIVDLTRICSQPEEQSCVSWVYRKGFDSAVFGLNPAEIGQQGWKQIKQFPVWMSKEDPAAGTTFETYTFVAYFQASPTLLSQKQPGIAFQEIGEAFEIYINGNLIAQEGVVKDGKITLHRTVRDAIYEFDRGYLQPGTNQLVVKIQGDPRFDHTGFYAVRGYKIDSFAGLSSSREDRIGLVLISLYLFVGIYHLLLFWKRKQDRYNLFYALFAILLFVYLMTRHYVIFELPVDTRDIQRVELVVLYTLGPWLVLFFDDLFLSKLRKLSVGMAISGGVLSFVTLFLPMHLAEVVLRVWQITVPFMMGYGVYQLISAMRAKNRDAWRLLAGMIIFMVGAIFDILDSASFHTGLTLTKYSFSIFVIGIAVILANRFMRVHNSVEELNETLERKVEDRTRELSETLATVQAMKTQQDGDYFLTSLLISPLNANRADSRVFGVETLVSQKKKFRFKKWEAEIGGDIVTAHNIILAGKRYVAFLNGDAMGKSIQGAGGALVLGTVFKSLITRTQSSPVIQSRMPERWLKECFLELQNTFVSFDGTMLISAVMGLADESTGLVYFINAEHPWIAAYYREKASFIESELALRKIGVYGLEGNLSVKTYQMRPGEVLILGSDGRDDLAMNVDQEGKRLINEDTELFLRLVEAGRGDLQKIFESIEKAGEIIDDVTLMRIGYLEDGPFEKAPPGEECRKNLEFAREQAASEKHADAAIYYSRAVTDPNCPPEAYLELAQAHIKLKNFAEAYDAARRYASLDPQNPEGYYLSSYAGKLAGNYNRAADFGECLRLRDPRNVRNLVNLADTYRAAGDKARAAKIVDEALELDAGNENAKRVKALL